MPRSGTRISATSPAAGGGRIELVEATGPERIGHCRELFVEYQRGLGVSLCFQGFEAELASLPGDYAPPLGRLYLALAGGKPAACVALRPLFHRDAEMKRLYVRPAYRGAGLGRMLATRVIEEARTLGYEVLKLDTLPAMRAAQGLYAGLGFVETARYNDNPVSGVRFLALELRAAPTRGAP
jgi:ribosomal protein S18 acetylase RimI-like enzyme